MEIVDFDGGVLLKNADFDIKHTFECGQCFRFVPKNGGYLGVAYGKALYLKQTENGVFLDCNRSDFDTIWRDFLDLDTDYERIASGLPQDDFTKTAVAFGKGLRILRQEPWEALCSFIISQCNNIPRIQGIINKLCMTFGDEIICKGEKLYTFPSASRLADLNETDLDCLKAGYRVPYIINAAKLVTSKKLDFDDIVKSDTFTARKTVMGIYGVGAKVADCFLLFGMHKLDAFPVDTWMKKAAVYYGGKFDPALFGEYAGIAQQYIFYYARSGKGV